MKRMPARFVSLWLAGCLAVDPALAAPPVLPFAHSTSQAPGCFLENAIPGQSVWGLRPILHLAGLVRSRLQAFLFYPDLPLENPPSQIREKPPTGKLRRLLRRLESPLIIPPGILHYGMLVLTALAAMVFFKGRFATLAGLSTGFLFTLLFGNPNPKLIKWFASNVLLPASIIGLGAGMDLHEVAQAGTQGFAITLAGISVTMVVGTLLGRRLRVNHVTSFLTSWGTSICGARAIAALEPFFDIRDEQDSVALSAIFILNTLALFLFPVIGRWAGLTSAQFGYWCALAIHDTSSVVGAALAFSAAAMTLAVQLKLARALWIVPATLAMALLAPKKPGTEVENAPMKTAFQRWRGRIAWFFATTWFMFGYVLAVWLFSHDVLKAQASGVAEKATHLFVTVLFFIGTGLSVKNLSKVGWRPYLHGAGLWLIVSIAWLLIITQTRIADLPFLHTGSSQVIRPISGRTGA